MRSAPLEGMDAPKAVNARIIEEVRLQHPENLGLATRADLNVTQPGLSFSASLPFMKRRLETTAFTAVHTAVSLRLSEPTRSRLSLEPKPSGSTALVNDRPIRCVELYYDCRARIA